MVETSLLIPRELASQLEKIAVIVITLGTEVAGHGHHLPSQVPCLECVKPS
jgi:hypothetical protein